MKKYKEEMIQRTTSGSSNVRNHCGNHIKAIMIKSPKETEQPRSNKKESKIVPIVSGLELNPVLGNLA